MMPSRGGLVTPWSSVAGHRHKIIIDDLTVSFETGLVPGGSELAATANVGNDVTPPRSSQSLPIWRIGRVSETWKPP